MNGHPGGKNHTLQMIELSGLKPPAKVLDMGAGSGQSVQLLQDLGFDAEGIDLNAACASDNVAEKNTLVTYGDFLSPSYDANHFDGILSQCAFYVSGNVHQAFLSAHRLLKPNGIFMLSDVCPKDTSLKDTAKTTGFEILHYEDLTPAWKEYYIEAIWRGTACSFPCSKKMNYEMLICKKLP